MTYCTTGNIHFNYLRIFLLFLGTELSFECNNIFISLVARPVGTVGMTASLIASQRFPQEINFIRETI